MVFGRHTSDTPAPKMSKRAVRQWWAAVLLLMAMHPVLLYLLYPIFGDVVNVGVIVAPITASYLLGWRIGHLFILINVFASALVFKYTAGRGAEERPKMVIVFLILSGLCFGADRLRIFILQRKALAEELDQAKKMEAIGRLAGGVAHDMNNNLNAILSSVYALKKEMAAFGRAYPDLDTITAACERGAQLTQNLLGFARKSTDRTETFSVNVILDGVRSILERTVSKDIRIETSLAPETPCIEGDKSQIENAVMNLCLNSLDAMGEHGELTLSTTLAEKEVAIGVSDTGTGMDKSVRERVFEPFYTTKAAGRGTGLGLSMVYGVVHAMRGRISLDTAPGEGTTFTLFFPLSQADAPHGVAANKGAESTEDSHALYGRTILIIDDEALVLRAGVRMLSSIGCEVLSASSGKEGLQRFKENSGKVDLVLVDLIMPEMDGIATVEGISEIDPTTPVILVSGYTRESKKIADLERFGDRVRFLSKPYRPEQLIETALDILNTSIGVHAS